MKRVLILFTILFSLLAVLLFCAVGYYAAVTKDTVLDEQSLSLTDTSIQLFDGNGTDVTAQLLGEGLKRTQSELPSMLKRAFISVEDKDFYTHNGICFRRIVKAALKNLTSFSFKEGASTISQQLVKNTQLTSEKTIRRKLKEYKLTRILERRYTKEEIMKLYLNSIYFGHESFGVHHAAKFYFDKDVQDLTLSECAMLSALVKSPNRYSPFRDREKCLARRNFVLDQMKEQGYVSSDEAERAKRDPLPTAPHFVEGRSSCVGRIYEELSALFPNAKTVDYSHLKVDTYLDVDLQKYTENLQTDSDFSVIIRDNHTNGIKAFSSSVGSICRTPASVIKPLLVYAPAIEENLISPATPLLDEPICFSGYSPSNYGGGYEGYVSARYALSRSINVPAVKLLNSLGVEKGVSYLNKMDLFVLEEDQTLALALGGMKNGFSLPSLVDGYAVFASGGKFSPSSIIRQVRNENGEVIYRSKSKETRVFSDDVCALMNSMLKTCAEEGTAKKLRALPFDVYAKTGTAGTEKGNTDAYTVAYTADDTVGVWLGNADNTPVSCTGGGTPCNLVFSLLQQRYRHQSPTPTLPCNDVITVSLDREEYEKNHRLVKSDELSPPNERLQELFRASNPPKEENTRFSRPTIEKPTIFVENGTICIQLCQAYYYEYLIERENNGKKTVIYRGNYRERIYDNSVVNGERYVYTVTPIYNDNVGTPVVLPAVFTPSSTTPPSDWWE